jgi:ferrous iron transport protein A
MNAKPASRDGEALSTIPAGEGGLVSSLHGGHGFCSRVANLGFTAGAEVRVIQNYGRRPIIVSVRGTRVALGRAEAANVQIKMRPETVESQIAEQSPGTDTRNDG